MTPAEGTDSLLATFNYVRHGSWKASLQDDGKNVVELHSQQVCTDPYTPLFRGVGAVAAGPAIAAPLLSEDRKIKICLKMPKTRRNKIVIAVLHGPSHVLYNHVHVLLLTCT